MQKITAQWRARRRLPFYFVEIWLHRYEKHQRDLGNLTQGRDAMVGSFLSFCRISSRLSGRWKDAIIFSKCVVPKLWGVLLDGVG